MLDDRTVKERQLWSRGVKYSVGVATVVALGLSSMPLKGQLWQMLAGAFLALGVVLFVIGWWPWLRSRLRSAEKDEPIGYREQRRRKGKVARRFARRYRKSLEARNAVIAIRSNKDTFQGIMPGGWRHGVVVWWTATDLRYRARRWRNSLRKFEPIAQDWIAIERAMVGAAKRQKQPVRDEALRQMKPVLVRFRDNFRHEAQQVADLKEFLDARVRGISRRLNYVATLLEEAAETDLRIHQLLFTEMDGTIKEIDAARRR